MDSITTVLERKERGGRGRGREGEEEEMGKEELRTRTGGGRRDQVRERVAEESGRRRGETSGC